MNQTQKSVFAQIFAPIDIAIYGGLSTLAWVLSVLATLAGNSGGPLVLMYVVAIGFTVISGLLVAQRIKIAKQFQFRLKQGVTVGWIDSAYQYPEQLLNDFLEPFVKKCVEVYGDRAKECFVNAYVLFREPAWIQDNTANLGGLQKVAGEEAGGLCLVGWRPNLHDTGFLHELGHIVIAMFEGNPPEQEAHKIMAAKLGV